MRDCESSGRAVLVACAGGGENSVFPDHFRSFPSVSAQIRRWSDRLTVRGWFVNCVAEPSLLRAPAVVKILFFPIISERFCSNPPMVRRAHHEGMVCESRGIAVLVAWAARGENSDISAHFRVFPLKSADGSTGSPRPTGWDWLPSLRSFP